jgi:hypothetical protein
MINAWKKQAVEGMATVFAGKAAGEFSRGPLERDYPFRSPSLPTWRATSLSFYPSI